VTEAGIRKNINIGILYLQAWLKGQGCVPLYNMMEDAATAEISRTQLWQWRRHKAMLQDARGMDDALMARLIDEEVQKLGAGDRYLADAVALFRDLVMAEALEEFLTTKAYDKILSYERTA